MKFGTAVGHVLARAPLLFGLSIAALVVRVLLIPDPILMHDEYFYAKTAQLWSAHQQDLRQITRVPHRGEAGFPNALFFAIYSIAYKAGDNFYIVGKLLNVLFATIAVLGVRRVAMCFMGASAATLVAALALWLPSTGYLSYFMPEALYDSLVWWGLAAFMLTVERDVRVASAWLGALLGAALLAKPNAAALLVASHLVIALLAWRALPVPERIKRVVASWLVLDLAFAATGYALNTVLTGHWQWDPVGSFYHTSLAQAAAIEASGSFAFDLARYAFVYVYALLFAFGAIVLVLCASGCPDDRGARSVALWGYATVGIALLLLGSAKVGVNWERVFVNHVGVYSTRYMSVLFPLLVIAYADSFERAVRHVHARRVWGAVLAIALIALAYAYRSIDNPTQLPEIFATSRAYARLYKPTLLAGLGVLVYCAWAQRPRVEAYVAFIVAYAVLSAVGLVREDMRRERDWEAKAYSDVGRTLREVVAPGAEDQGLIVSVGPSPPSRVMTLFPGIVPVQLVARDERPAREALTGRPRWVLFVDGVQPGFDDARCVAIQAARLCELAPGALR